MATRTSHSSPCFLRVAEASAASSASKITSLSTPFSLDTASTTIRISLFTTLVPSVTFGAAAGVLGREPCLADLGKSHRHLLTVDLELDARLIDRQQRAGVAAPPGARLLQLDEHPRAHEASEVRPRAQHAVEARRGHFQRVGVRDGILEVKERGYLAADGGAVIERDAGVAVDEEPQRPVRAARGELELDELIP